MTVVAVAWELTCRVILCIWRPEWIVSSMPFRDHRRFADECITIQDACFDTKTTILITTIVYCPFVFMRHRNIYENMLPSGG